MNFSLQPPEIKDYIVGFINPEKLSRDSVKACANDLSSLSLMNAQMKEICKKKLSELKQIYDLLNKYKVYQFQYENPWKHWETGKEYDAKGNPQLYDALLTGLTWPHAESSFNEYNEKIESDIKTIVKLTPESLNCILGSLRCRDNVTPLYAACVNTNIPIHIVEFLLQSGANPNDTMKFNGNPAPIICDIKANVSSERFSQIKVLFLKYGFKE